MFEKAEGTFPLEKPEPSSEQDKINVNQTNENISPDVLTTAVSNGKIEFGYPFDAPKDKDLISQLNDNAEGNDSVDGLLARNEQIQSLLSEVLSDYKNYIGTDKENLKLLIKQEKTIIEKDGLQGHEEQSAMIESMYEYMLTNDNQLGFENFIRSNSINVIKAYLSNHIDKDGNISFISKNEIKAKLKIYWFINLYKNYKQDHLDDSQNLDQLEMEISQLKDVFSFVKNSIDYGIQQYLGGKYQKDGLAQYLNKFFKKAKESEELKNFLDGKDENSIIGLIRYGIKEYARLLDISDSSPQLRSTGDDVFDMQIRSYLYLYGMIAYDKGNQTEGLNGINFDPKKGLDDNELGEILRAILITDGIIKDDGKNKYLQSEQNLRNNQIKIDVRKRQISRMRINDMNARRSKAEGQLLTQEKTKMLDIQNATGVEIVQDKDLGSKIRGFDRDNKGSETSILPLPIQRRVLRETGKTFIIENQQILSKYLDISDIVNFFDVKENGVIFNYDNWDSFKNKWMTDYPDNDISELNIIETVLLKLPHKYEENLAKAKTIIDEKKDDAHEIIKDYAIGAIIDNIKDMFQYIVDTNNTGNFIDGFKFDERNPAKIDNNCLLLSGKFNGETLNIRYDLNTGKLYMNSFFDVTPANITLKGNDEPTYEIGELESFDNVLYEFYKSPTKSMNDNVFSKRKSFASKKTGNIPGGNQQDERSTTIPPMRRLSDMRNKIKEEHKRKFQQMCGTKLDEIGGNIKDKVEKKSTRDPVTLNLLRSLGIMPETGTKIFVGGDIPSDLYKIVQLITNEQNTEAINNFSNYMKSFMEMIGLSRGENIDHQDKTRDISKIIFDQNNKQKYISYVRECTQGFDNEYSVAKGKDQFDKKSNFGILKIIEENFTDGTYPNRRIDNEKISKFNNELNSDISNVHYKENVLLVENQDEKDAENLINSLTY